MWIYLTKYERPSHWIRGLGSPMLCAQKTRSADYLNIQNDFFFSDDGTGIYQSDNARIHQV